MNFPLLFRRQNLIFPTLAGWLVILASLILIVGLLFRNMALILTVNEPVGAEFLVVEAWMGKEELDQGMEYFKANNYSNLVLVGGPISNDFHGIDVNYAERAATYLMKQGLSREATGIVRSPYSSQNRTFLNAVMVREWFKQQGISITLLDIFSRSVHSRRSRSLYQQAFGDQVTIGIIAAEPINFDPAYWWRTSDSGKGVAVEFANWILSKCCFNPGLPGSHMEKWGVEGLEKDL